MSDAFLPPDTDEAELLRAARRGDPEAFARLYQLHAKAIHSLVLRLSGSIETAEDITQDTFERILHLGDLVGRACAPSCRCGRGSSAPPRMR